VTASGGGDAQINVAVSDDGHCTIDASGPETLPADAIVVQGLALVARE
jgi:hypothetical protein